MSSARGSIPTRPRPGRPSPWHRTPRRWRSWPDGRSDIRRTCSAFAGSARTNWRGSVTRCGISPRHGTPMAQRQNDKGSHMCKPPDCLARPAGFEPTTPWFVGREIPTSSVNNQPLAALTHSILSLLPSQFWHRQHESSAKGEMPSIPSTQI
jgi:hypothetical protein